MLHQPQLAVLVSTPSETLLLASLAQRVISVPIPTQSLSFVQLDTLHHQELIHARSVPLDPCVQHPTIQRSSRAQPITTLEMATGSALNAQLGPHVSELQQE